MANLDSDGPKEGDLVVCSVTTVKQNGAYVSLDGYPNTEGFIFIGEIASGWVKNIRSIVREGQRVVCKVLRISTKDGRSIELSLKSVSDERRRDTLQSWKNEKRAIQLMRVVGEKIGWNDSEIDEISQKLTDSFGTLYGSFEESAINSNALKDAGFEDDWILELISVAEENIIPPFVVIKGNFNMQYIGDEGVEIIKEALIQAESFTDEDAEVKVECFYDGAPNGSSNGGNGKSLLVKCLGNLMNLTELDGKTFKKGKEQTM